MTKGDGYTFVEINEQQFDDFACHHVLGNFLQSPGIARRRQWSGWRPTYLALMNGGRIVGAGLFQWHQAALGYYDVECQEGPLLDYNDDITLDTYLRELESYMKPRKVTTLRINPPITTRIYAANAQLMQTNPQGDDIIRLFSDHGFRQLNNDAVDANPLLLRWYFTKDLSSYSTTEELLASVDQRTRRAINKTIKLGVRVRIIDRSDGLTAFADLMRATGQRQGFDTRESEYYTSMFSEFPRDQAIFVEAYLDIDERQRDLERQVVALDEMISALDKGHDQYVKQHQKLVARRDKVYADIEQIEALGRHGRSLSLAVALFMRYGSELVYFLGGSDDRYRVLGGGYAIQHWGMQYAIQHKIKSYNFYGTNGSFNGHPEQDGVYQFKRGFGGVIQEQLGYFVATPRPVAHHIHRGVRLTRRFMRAAALQMSRISR